MHSTMASKFRILQKSIVRRRTSRIVGSFYLDLQKKIVPNEIQDFDKFKTDFGKVMKYIAVSDDKKALEQLQHDDGFKSIDVDSVRLLNEFTNSKIEIQEGEVKMDMCKGLKELLEDRREEGIGLGANKKLREQVEKKIKKGYSVVEMADMLEEDEETITSLVKEIQLCTNN